MTAFLERFVQQRALDTPSQAVDFVNDYPGNITTTAIPSSRERVAPSQLGRRLWTRLVRSAAYAVASLPLTLLWIIVFSTVFSLVVSLVVVGVGLLLLPLGMRSVGLAGHVERWVLLEVLDEHIEAPVRLTREPGLRSFFLTPVQDASYWRELVFIALRVFLAPLSFAAFVGTIALSVVGFSSVLWVPINDGSASVIPLWLIIGCAALIVGPLILLALTALEVSLARGLLGPGSQALTTRATTAVRNRDLSVAAAEAERRRIERDLHDGAQARLATVALDLGRAKRRLEKDGGDEELEAIIDTAHNDAKQAIVELRNLARGIHPAVLTDRGLDAALSDVAARCATPVHLDVNLLQRPAPHVESAAYFAVCELLTNITKHSRATQAWVTVRGDSVNLRITVTDNGVGGAEHALGSGLLGLHERITGMDGSLAVSSPLGEGTSALIELPLQRQTQTGAT